MLSDVMSITVRTKIHMQLSAGHRTANQTRGIWRSLRQLLRIVHYAEQFPGLEVARKGPCSRAAAAKLVVPLSHSGRGGCGCLLWGACQLPYEELPFCLIRSYGTPRGFTRRTPCQSRGKPSC